MCARSPAISSVSSMSTACVLYSAALLFLTSSLSACQERRSSRAPQAFEPVTLQETMRSLARDAALLPAGDGEALAEFQRAQLRPLLMSEQELLSALQPKGGAPSAQVSALITRYQEVLAPSFIAEAPAVLAHAHQQGLTQVRVTRVGPSRGAANTPGDLKLLEALPKRPPLYHVRYLKEGSAPDTQRGLRLNGFLYTPSGWRTLLKLGESLEAWRAADLR